MEIQNNSFVVSGGASGLGGATVEMLVQNGGNVVIADLNMEMGDCMSRKLGPAVRFVKTDVANEQEVQRAVTVAVEAFGSLAGAISCAGIVPAAKIYGRKGPHPLSTFNKSIAVNLTGTFNLVRFAVEAMAQNEPNDDGERGVLINVASIAAFDGQIGQTAYAAAKGGVISMTLPLARELAQLGIRVMAVAPGVYNTPMMAGLPDKVRQSLEALVPFPSRMGRPPEFAALIKHIIHDVMLNGEVIRQDGALRMPA